MPLLKVVSTGGAQRLGEPKSWKVVQVIDVAHQQVRTSMGYYCYTCCVLSTWLCGLPTAWQLCLRKNINW